MNAKLVIVSQNQGYVNKWVKALKSRNPKINIEVYPNDSNRRDTEFILAFRPPSGALKQFPSLKVIASMAAGVRHLLSDPDLPEDVTITKMNDFSHKQDMALFSLSLVLSHIKSLMTYHQLKDEKKWEPQALINARELNIGVMGIGAIGSEIAELMKKTGFNVSGWSRSPKNLDGVSTFNGADELIPFLNTANILICVLPLTTETKGILNRENFKHLPDNAYLINIGRGGHLIDEDLLEAIDSGKLSGAALDVFNEEPLPLSHPFWAHKKILITPHIGGNTDLSTAAATVLENYKAFLNGSNLKDVIDISRGY